MKLEKYVGQIVEMIYAGPEGFSQRRVKVLAVEGGIVRAFCFERQAPRTFRAEGVLAVMPAGMVKRRAAQ